MNFARKFGTKTGYRPGDGLTTFRAGRSRNGFTLVEMLTAMTVLLLILGIIAAATNSASTTMKRSQADIGAFAAARTAFENMSQKLSQATLNTYWDYYNAAGLSRGAFASADAKNGTTTTGGFVPATYGRTSDLHFWVRRNTQQYSCGQEVYFQTPVAYSSTSYYQDTQGLLNAGGFYVEYCPDSYRPNPIANAAPVKWRYRLMQGLEPTENFSVFSNVSAVLATEVQPTATSWTWINNVMNENTGGGGAGAGTISTNAVPIADNVIALIVWPRLPIRIDPNGNTITTDYTWNSKNDMNKLPTSTTLQKPYDEQLPPIVGLTAVVIDEASASRIATNTSSETVLAGPSGAFAVAKTNSGTPGTTIFSDVTNPNQLNLDLNALSTELAKRHINYRILSTYVVMRESKWSQ
jgi:uncharacterized protein (TIGR02599 family)